MITAFEVKTMLFPINGAAFNFTITRYNHRLKFILNNFPSSILAKEASAQTESATSTPKATVESATLGLRLIIENSASAQKAIYPAVPMVKAVDKPLSSTSSRACRL